MKVSSEMNNSNDWMLGLIKLQLTDMEYVFKFQTSLQSKFKITIIQLTDFNPNKLREPMYYGFIKHTSLQKLEFSDKDSLSLEQIWFRASPT